MPEQNVELARDVVHAFNRRDLAALTQRFDSEIEWAPGGPAAVERAELHPLDRVEAPGG